MLALLLILSCATPDEEPAPPTIAPQARRPPPLPPTEHWVHQDAEMQNKARRKAWFKERHRAPPDVDYKAIERANGLEQLERRNRIGGRRPVDAFGARWVERGSENQAGRMMVTATTDTHLYAGSSLGGVWRGSLEGDDWEPLGDNLYGGAHWLLVFPPDGPGGPDALVAATDDGLVHRSADGGVTWTVPAGIGDSWGVRRLAQLPDGTAFLVLREAGGDRHRLFRSADSGRSWTAIVDLGGFRGDVAVSRTGADLYLAGPGTRIRHSADRGDTWQDLAPIPAAGSLSGIEIALNESGPTLYAATDGPGDPELWRSADPGASWTQLGDLEDYWGVLVASTADPDRVAWGGVEVHLSRDGGQSFDVVNAWYDYYDDPVNKLHADIMGIDVIPDGAGGETWYVNTDGGLYRSTDALDTVLNLSTRGLRVSQYYDTLTDATDPSRVAAGSQDQGYQLTNGIAQAGDRWDFEQILSGDYGHLTSSDGSHAWVYSVYPGFVLAQQGGDEPVLHYVDYPSDPRIAWLPHVVADPDKKRAVFLPGARLHRAEYDAAADEWTWEQWSDTNFSLDGYEYLAGFDFSRVDPERAYAATSYGRLFHSSDRGRTWTESSSDGPGAHYFYGAAVLASSAEADTAWVAGSGYGGPAVYRTRNGGQTWTAFDEGLPSTLVYSLCEAPDGSGTLLAGSESSAWRRDKGAGQEWVEITGAEAPSTIYWSCEALQHENTVRFGTYGRGIWDYQLDPEGLGCFPPVDRDGDGHACDVDCDDADPEVHPDADDDPCDGVDRDCDPTNDRAPAECAAVEEGKQGCGCAVPANPGPLGLLLLLALFRGRSVHVHERPAEMPTPSAS